MTDDVSTSQPNTPLSLERKTSAVKDKECRFCGQFFTQSSLGRHLDQWIKPDNPKEPDGKHDIEAIKGIRGKVTRRTMGPKAPPKRTLTPASSTKGAVSEAASPIAPALHARNSVSSLSRLAAAQGNPSPLSLSVPKVRNASSRQVSRQASRVRHLQLKTDLEERQKTTEEQDNAKAVELALKEVLHNVQSACSRNATIGLFDFDPHSLSFPALCLHILPSPPSLGSATPFPSKDSWSIAPPGRQQLDALQRHLKDRLEHCQQSRQQALLTPRSSISTNSPLATPPASEFDVQRISRLHSHVEGAYKSWERLRKEDKEATWQLEILRCHARTTKSRDSLQRQLEDAQREIARLKAQPWKNIGMDAMKYTEMAVKAYSTSFQVPLEAARDMSELCSGARNFDYNHLIEKWRMKLQEVRGKSQGMASQQTLVESNVDAGHGSNGSSSRDESETISPGATSDLRQHPPSAATTISTGQDTVMDESCPDQVDALGEEDDADGDVDLDGMAEDISPHTLIPNSTIPAKFDPPRIQPRALAPQHHPQQQQQQQQQQMQMHPHTPVTQHQPQSAHPQHIHMQQGQMMWDPGHDPNMQRRSSHPALLQHHPHMLNTQQMAMMPMDHLDFSGRGMMHSGLQEMYTSLGGGQTGD